MRREKKRVRVGNRGREGIGEVGEKEVEKEVEKVK